jgi:hypothetical protein
MMVAVLLMAGIAAVITNVGQTAEAAGSGPTSCTACGPGEQIFGGTDFAGVYNVPTAGGTIHGYCISPGGWYPDSTHDAAGGFAVANAAVWAEFINLSDYTSDLDQAGVGARMQRDLFGRNDFSAISAAARARSDALWTQANRLAGPWATQVSYHTNDTVTVSVTAASGALVPNATVSLAWANAAGPVSVDTGGGAVTVAFAPKFGAPGRVTATGRRIGPLSLLRWVAEVAAEQNVTSISGPVDAAPDSAQWTITKPSLVTIVKQGADTGAPVAGAVLGFSDTATGAPFAHVTTKTTPVPVLGLDNRAGQRVYYRELVNPQGYLADGASGSFVVGTDGGTIALVMKDSAATPSCASQASASWSSAQANPPAAARRRAGPPGPVVFGLAGGPIGDSVTCDGLPPNNAPFTVAEDLVNVPAPTSGLCSGLTPAQWTAGTAVASATITMPATPTAGSGPYSITGSTDPALTIPTGLTGCLGWRGSTTPWPGAAQLVLDPVPAEQVTLVNAQLFTRVQQQRVLPGGTIIDTVTVSGLPAALVGPFPATADLRSVPAVAGSCTQVTATAFQKVAPYTTVPFTIDHGNGSYQVRVTAPADKDRCLNFTERFTRPLWPGGPTPTAEVGVAAETTFVDHPPVQVKPPVKASGGGGGNGRGLAYTGANPGVALVIGLLLAGIGGLLVLVAGRRRRSSRG